MSKTKKIFKLGKEEFELVTNIPLSVGMVLNFENCPMLYQNLKPQARYIVTEIICNEWDNSVDCVIEEI
jgi:hypothetical protein